MMNWDDPLGLGDTQEEKKAPVVKPEPAKPESAKQEPATASVARPEPQSAAEPNQVEEAAVAYQADQAPAEPLNVTKENTHQNAMSGVEPVRAEDKRVINGLTDVNQLAPFKYPWAWKFFLNANKNHWTPLDINMTQDVIDYNKTLTEDEKHVYQNVLSYLTTSDILAMRNIGLAVMEKMSAPELQIYQARQVYEEALHTWTYQHCIETIGLDQGEIYNRYRVVPEINQKIQVANRRLNSILRPNIDLNDPDEMENFVLAYMFFGAIFEGCWFYNGFSPIFALQRRGLMKGTAEQLQYIMRDEVMHASFGIRVCKQIIEEEKITIDPAKIRHMWDESEAAEAGYAKYLLRRPILGYSAEDHIEQFRYIANRRARQLGIDEPFPGAECTLPWLDEQSNLRKEKNFFETRVTEYQTGGALSWD